MQLSQAAVSANWFGLLGVPLQVGRGFAPGDDDPKGQRVVVLSDPLWRTRFGADSGVVGRSVLLDGIPTVVVGVAPAGFAFPVGSDVWIPQVFDAEDLSAENRGNHSWRAVGRLAPAVTLAAARSQLITVSEQLRQQFLSEDAHFHYTLAPLRDVLVGDTRTALIVLFAAVTCVLLIASANVANLLLVRATGRSGELGIRMALGAGRSRIVRQLVAESVILAIVGGVLGVLLANAGLRVVIALHPGDIPRLDEVTLSGPVLAFSGLVTMAIGVLFGVAPALHASSSDIAGAFKSGTRGTSASRSTGRTRATLVGAEMALAVLLLVGAGLLSRSFVKLVDVDPGFRPEQVVHFNVSLTYRQYTTWAQRQQFVDGLVTRLAALPGVEGAAAGWGLPFSGDMGEAIMHVVGRPPEPPDHQDESYIQFATPHYFATLGIPLRSGRVFTDGDRAGGHQVVLVNEIFAHRYFPTGDAIGHTITVTATMDSTPGHTVNLGGEIVGIVGDTKTRNRGAPAEATTFFPFDQASSRGMTFYVRTRGDPRAMLAAVRPIVAAADPEVPIFQAGTLTDIVQSTVARPKLYAWVVGAFAAAALLLAAIGIYGVMAYAVQERRRELGIRLALGARTGQIAGLVLGNGLRIAGIGLGLGLAAAFLSSRLLASLLYGVAPTDPPIYVGVCIALLTVAALASWIPARRAAAVDPVIAMQPE